MFGEGERVGAGTTTEVRDPRRAHEPLGGVARDDVARRLLGGFAVEEEAVCVLELGAGGSASLRECDGPAGVVRAVGAPEDVDHLEERCAAVQGACGVLSGCGTLGCAEPGDGVGVEGHAGRVWLVQR